MMLCTKDLEILDLVRRALIRAELGPGQVLQAWNARVAAPGGVVVMESGATIYLDHILRSLRVYVGDESLPNDWRYLPVHVRTLPAGNPSIPKIDPRIMATEMIREGEK